MKGDKADLEVLSLERASLSGCPFYAVLGNGDFDIGTVGDFFDEIEQLADYVTMLADCDAWAQDYVVFKTYPTSPIWPLQTKRILSGSP